MPRRRFFKLAEAMAMILEDDDVADGDVVVLPPSKADEHSDCEYFDDNEMLTTDSLPGDVAGSVEVHYSTVTDKEPAPTATSPPKRGRCPRKKKPTAAVMEPSRKSSRVPKPNKSVQNVRTAWLEAAAQHSGSWLPEPPRSCHSI